MASLAKIVIRFLAIVFAFSAIPGEAMPLSEKNLLDIISELQTTVKGLEKKLNDRLENLAKSMMEDKQDRHKRLVLSESQVAFYTQLTQDLGHLGQKQTIVFNNVVTNIGAGYNQFTGMFTAPAPGTYVFTWMVQNTDRTHMRSELVLNDEPKGMAWADAYQHTDVESASNTVVLQLSSGDAVWIRANYAGSAPVSQQGSMQSTFSGWLLYEN